MTRRVVTAVMAAPLVIAIICLPTWIPFATLLAIVAVLALVEAVRLLPWFLAGVYVLVPLGCLAVIRMQGPAGLPLSPGAFAIVQILFATWAGDSAAYFLGRTIGRHAMAPNVSPNKTWEGAGANLAFCVLISWLCGNWASEPLWLSLSVGISIGVLGQGGDLLESYLKRRVGVKDSGTLLPGHGGILDRIDSLLLPAPALLFLFLLAR